MAKKKKVRRKEKKRKMEKGEFEEPPRSFLDLGRPLNIGVGIFLVLMGALNFSVSPIFRFILGAGLAFLTRGLYQQYKLIKKGF